MLKLFDEKMNEIVYKKGDTWRDLPTINFVEMASEDFELYANIMQNGVSVDLSDFNPHKFPERGKQVLYYYNNETEQLDNIDELKDFYHNLQNLVLSKGDTIPVKVSIFEEKIVNLPKHLVNSAVDEEEGSIEYLTELAEKELQLNSNTEITCLELLDGTVIAEY